MAGNQVHELRHKGQHAVVVADAQVQQHLAHLCTCCVGAGSLERATWLRASGGVWEKDPPTCT